MDRPLHLFISYRRSAPDDSRLAHRLKDCFERAGHEVFIDTGMGVGTDWVVEIERQVAGCDCFVVLLSADSVASPMVQGEVRAAHRRRQAEGQPRILPVRVGFDGPLGYELDSYLGRLQCTRWSAPADDDRVCVELLDAVLAPDVRPPAVESASPAAARDPSACASRMRDLLLDLPRWNDERRRRNFIEMALHGHPVLEQVDLKGAGADVAVELVQRCLEFDQPTAAGLSPLCALLAAIPAEFGSRPERDREIATLRQILACTGPNPAHR